MYIRAEFFQNTDCKKSTGLVGWYKFQKLTILLTQRLSWMGQKNIQKQVQDYRVQKHTNVILKTIQVSSDSDHAHQLNTNKGLGTFFSSQSVVPPTKPSYRNSNLRRGSLSSKIFICKYLFESGKYSFCIRLPLCMCPSKLARHLKLETSSMGTLLEFQENKIN